MGQDLSQADCRKLSLTIRYVHDLRLMPSRRAWDLIHIQVMTGRLELDDLKAAQLTPVARAVFLTLETSPGNFQAWVVAEGCGTLRRRMPQHFSGNRFCARKPVSGCPLV